MSSANTLPALSTSTHSYTFYNNTDSTHKHQQQQQRHSARVTSRPQSPAPSLLHMNFSEADTALQQQSKRLAGLSITNATGTKVSILNDNMAEPTRESSPEPLLPQASPRSPLCELPPTQENFDGRRDYPAEEHAYAQHHSQQQQHHRPQASTQHQPSPLPQSHHSAESNFEAGRSSSLTNASTPIYSSQELATATTSAAKGLLSASQRSRSLSSGSTLSPRIPSASTSGRPKLISTGSTSTSVSASAASPTYPFFTRSYSEDNQSDDSESQRRMSDPNSGNAESPGPTFVKRRYSCTFAGCNKCFTTSGHLARHNRIHTGERNFPCLMPGCPSKFSRQDNMMQHYRTHVSPKSRRGPSKKQESHNSGLGIMVSGSQETLTSTLVGRESSPAVRYFGNEHEHEYDHEQQQHKHHHVTKMGSSRQNSPPRFNPLDRSGSVEHSSGSGLRHKKSGIVQTHQHHTPMPHFNVQAMTLAHQQAQQDGQSGSISNSQSTLPSPLTPTMAQTPYHHQPGYVPPPGSYITSVSSRQQESDSTNIHSNNKHPVERLSPTPSINNNGRYHRSEAVLASPTSPMTQDIKRMEGVEASLEHDRSFASQTQLHPQHHKSSELYQQYHHQNHSHHHHRPLSHAGHASSGLSPSQNGVYQLPPLMAQGQGQERTRSLGSLSSVGATPLSPQSTPHTPTKYRFDPIQDCLQQEKQLQQQQQQQHHSHRQYQHQYQHYGHQARENTEQYRDHFDQREKKRYDAHARYVSHYHGAAAAVAASSSSSTYRSASGAATGATGPEDEEMSYSSSTTTRSSAMSSASSMTSMTSVPSSSLPAPTGAATVLPPISQSLSKHGQSASPMVVDNEAPHRHIESSNTGEDIKTNNNDYNKGSTESSDEMSGLAHLAQIVTTFG